MRSVVIDARTALTGGGATVLSAVKAHLVPLLDGVDVTVREPGEDGRALTDSPALPLTVPGRQPDVVVSLSEASNLGAGGRDRTIMFARNWNCWQPEVKLRRKIRGVMARRNASIADVIVTATSTFADALVPHVGSDKPMVVVPFGVNELFTPEGPAAEGDYFLCVGDWYPWKNFEVAVAAFAELAERLPETTLRIAGREIHPDYVERTRQLAADLGIVDRLEVLGGVDHRRLAELYRGTRATVATSELETFGHPYLESMASGAPLVGRSMPVTQELVGEHGLLVEGDAQAFAAAMSQIVETDLKPMTAAALAHVGQFTWANFAYKLHALIEGGGH